MKKAIMYGAGKIGRGFIGKVFADSGYEVVFLDILRDLVDEINRRGEYPLRLISNVEAVDAVVKGVRAVDSTTEQAIDEIASCDIMATAVGVNNLPDIAPVIARGIAARMDRGGAPLDVLICENQLDARILVRELIYEHLDGARRAWADANLGLVETSISRMVPPVTPEALAEDRLLIRADPYEELPVDSAAFRGEIPALTGIVPFSPFEFYIKRKLFLNNGGHAVCAYLGYLKGYEYIWQAMADPAIYESTKAVMNCSAQALIHKFGNEVRENVENYMLELPFRFQNRALGDTVTRVGADPARKLRRNDRLVGAALFCLEQQVDPAPIARGIAVALKFDCASDPTAGELQKALRERGLGRVIEEYMGLKPDEPLFGIIREACETC